VENLATKNALESLETLNAYRMPINKNSQASLTVHTGKLSKATTTLWSYMPSPQQGLLPCWNMAARYLRCHPSWPWACLWWSCSAGGLSMGP